MAPSTPPYETVGPVYESQGARQQVTHAAEVDLAARRTARTVLARRTREGQWVYPAGRFTGTGTVHVALLPVLSALRDVDHWTAGIWQNTPHPTWTTSPVGRSWLPGAALSVTSWLAGEDCRELTS